MVSYGIYTVNYVVYICSSILVVVSTVTVIDVRKHGNTTWMPTSFNRSDYFRHEHYSFLAFYCKPASNDIFNMENVYVQPLWIAVLVTLNSVFNCDSNPDAVRPIKYIL